MNRLARHMVRRVARPAFHRLLDRLMPNAPADIVQINIVPMMQAAAARARVAEQAAYHEMTCIVVDAMAEARIRTVGRVQDLVAWELEYATWSTSKADQS